MNEEEKEADGYITLKEAARISGYTPDYIGQLIRKGKIHGRQIYTNIAWVTTEEAIKNYLDGNTVKEDKAHRDTPVTFRIGKKIEHALDRDGFQRVIRWLLYGVLGVVLLFVFALFYLYAWSESLPMASGQISQSIASERVSSD